MTASSDLSVNGSRASYARLEQSDVSEYRLSEREAKFIAARDSFYMATVSETGWPYIQHRGGAEGFVRIIDDKTVGFADFSGNRQYISVGNVRLNDRVSLFFMDYANRMRLKLLGRLKLVGEEDSDVLKQLYVPGYPARVERGMIISVEGYDWNCPQHINPRFSRSQVMSIVTPLNERIVELETLLRLGKNRAH